MSTIATGTRSKFDAIATALRDRSILSTGEIEALGVSREYLSKLVARGRLARASRGLYSLPDADITTGHTMALVGKNVPGGVICLMSALRLHGVTTQSPPDIWIAMPSESRVPQLAGIATRTVRLSGPFFDAGIETREIEGVPVRVYSLAKTVADCFKFRGKIGLDIALEALRESLRSRQVSVDDIWSYAKVNRVANVMRPYLEAIQ